MNRKGSNLYSTETSYIFMEFIEINNISSRPWEFELYIPCMVKLNIKS